MTKHNETKGMQEASQGTQGTQEAAQAVQGLPPALFEMCGEKLMLRARVDVGTVADVTIAKVASSAYIRQFRNNEEARLKAWQKKAEAWDKAKAEDKAEGERPANPCTVDQLLARYDVYTPDVSWGEEDNSAKLRKEAILRRLVEMFNEHNASIAAGTGGKYGFGVVTQRVPTGEKREQLLALVEASARQQEHIERHIAAIKAEKGTAKDKVEAPALDVTVVDF